MSKTITVQDLHTDFVRYLDQDITINGCTEKLKSIEKDRQMKFLSGNLTPESYTVTLESRWFSLDRDDNVEVQ